MPKTIKNTKRIFSSKKCFIIAEAGSNHNGDIKVAKKLIDAAAQAGADAIKFQLFSGEGLSNDSNVQRILDQFAFQRKWVKILKAYADQKKIMFLATPFDEQAADFLDEVGMAAFKISSGDLTYHRFVEYIAKKNKPIILSVGMADRKEIEVVLNIIRSVNKKEIVLLHCVADYPTKPEDANVKRIQSLRKTFSLPVGFSDHTLGVHIPLAAIALGAMMIEKHFTLSRKQKGPDHFFAIEPQELKQLVEQVRQIEKSLGSERIGPLKCEKLGMKYGRRSLYANRDIDKDEVFSEENVKVVRPSGGIPANEYGLVVNKKAKRKIRCGEAITWAKIK